MSGAILYPPLREDCDVGIIFIEVSGCLPMCGHGAIGTVTVALEHGLVKPRSDGTLHLDTPAGLVIAECVMAGDHVDRVKIRNIPSFLHSTGLEIDLPEMGRLNVDVAYGGNFYAIVEPQENYPGLDSLTPFDIQRLSPQLRDAVNAQGDFAHPEEPEISGVSHIMWTGPAKHPDADARNAVFYGDKAIDRSPCGTGTSARMAQLVARGDLAPGDEFVHESIIGTLFTGRVEAEAKVGDLPAIIPSIEGWARIHGLNTIFVDDRDPLAHGFLLH